ncbi:MAG: HAD family acid phosphatase [bacterium]|nr:HAD family acid phosphatase [bacterium]
MRRFASGIVAVIALCSLAAGVQAARVQLPNDVAWVYASDAYKGCVMQAYLNAGLRLRGLAGEEKPGTWCVVLDADETIISNVRHQVNLSVKGISHSREVWNEWCNEGKAAALPGAKEFCALVRELGGKVIIITNRQEAVKDATIKNLDALGFAYDACLMREGPYAMDRSKTVRREAVEKGTVKTLPEGKSLPPLKILMLVGDQTHDLYNDKSASFDDVKERYGRDFVMIPNPMYGEWESRGGYEVAWAEAPAKPAAPAAPASPAKPQEPGAALSPAEAKGMVGEEVVVEGTVVRVHTRERGPDMLNFDRNWREGLSVAVFNKERFGDLKAKYEGKNIRVRGKVSEYRGAAQIRVNDPSSIELAD